MKRVLIAAVLVWASVGAGVATRVSARQGAATVSARPAVQTPAAAPAEYRTLVTKYCVSCHNDVLKAPAADPVDLKAANLDNVAADPLVWERVVRKLGVGAMPPQGSPRPGAAELDGFRAWVATALDRAADAANNPGRFELHRLNRAEYANSIRDLLALDIDVAALLPGDTSEFGFDNIASGLRVTPALLERYLTAAVKISALAVGDPKAETTEDIFPVRLDFSQNNHVEGLPLGTRGGTLIHYNFPVDGEYLLAGSLFRPIDNGDSGLEGQDTPHEFEITIDGARVHSAKLGGPEDNSASFYNLTAAREAAAERMKIRLFVTAGPHDVGFTFVEKPARSQDTFEPSLRSSQDLHVGAGLAKLRHVAISGPYQVRGVGDTPSRRRLFVCTPKSASDELRCATEILSTVARRAYRRPVTDADVQPIVAFYKDARQGKTPGNFDAGIRAALPRILSSPAFLFRSEQDPKTPGAHAVTDLELASRLSFFLWSSIPDDELLNLAIQNKLRAPGVLDKQVRRMLADEKSSALTTNFPDQWLALRNLERASPDLLGFPEWDHNLRESMQRETELLFGSVIQEDRSALDLLNADYTFVNERLARHYGIPKVYGSEFRRVALTDPNRRGLLGQGSILTLTSVATRTSPVFRGKWILTNLLNTPPPAPPPNVPPLAENAGAAAPKSVRERLEAHRANAICASCHKNMDPIGFALENFDAVGRWRSTTESGSPVDASGVLVDGTKIDGPSALRQALAGKPDVFVGTVTEKLLTYALGRGLEAYDMPVVRGIVRSASRNDYRMMTIITEIVRSRPFQMRVNVPVENARVE